MKTLPEDFVISTRRVMGDERFGRFLRSFDDNPPVSVRIKRGEEMPKDSLADGQVPWCGDGMYLSERPLFTLDPLLHAGCYYVQEASSMFLSLVLRQHVEGKVRMLDLCAAPGGKSTLSLQTLQEGSILVSNEPVRTRANILAENLSKWGNPNVIVTNAFPKDLSATGLTFDVVLCDVPCSGEGMFRKDDATIGEWSVPAVERLWRLQREIVAEAWKMLKPDGLLIYSTCTFNTHENEENVRWIMDEYDAMPLEVATDKEWNITPSLLDGFEAPVYRFIPGLTRGEGLFMAALRKGNEAMPQRPRKDRKAHPGGKGKTRLPVNINDWLPEGFVPIAEGDRLYALPYDLVKDYEMLVGGRIRVVKAGVNVGIVKGRDFVPDIDLALCSCLASDAFPRHDVGLDTALAYLRRETIILPEGTDRGYVIITYRGHPLGFVKNIGSRANNLYPQEWRILKR